METKNKKSTKLNDLSQLKNLKEEMELADKKAWDESRLKLKEDFSNNSFTDDDPFEDHICRLQNFHYS